MKSEQFTGYIPPVAVSLIEGDPVAASVHRAIYHPHGKPMLEFLNDRNGWFGPESAHVPHLARLRKALKKIEAACAAAALDPKSAERFRYEDEHLVVVGTPNGSCGYMYVATWSKP